MKHLTRLITDDERQMFAAFLCRRVTNSYFDWNELMEIGADIYLKREVEDFTINFGRVKITLWTGEVIESPCQPKNNNVTELFLAICKFIQWYSTLSKGGDGE